MLSLLVQNYPSAVAVEGVMPLATAVTAFVPGRRVYWEVPAGD
jgi:hypothetical protein